MERRDRQRHWPVLRRCDSAGGAAHGRGHSGRRGFQHDLRIQYGHRLGDRTAQRSQGRARRPRPPRNGPARVPRVRAQRPRTMSTELIQATTLQPAAPLRLPPVPWRDPHTVPPARLKEYIDGLEKQCADNPRSADLRTCLGMAYAMNFEVYKSMDALELATQLEPDHFFAQLKWAELHYRLRVLIKAEEEALKAVELAANSWELSLARK